MSNSANGSFVAPPGFSEEEVEGQLYYEDLEEDDEIWLLRMPSDTELSDLDRQKVCLPDASNGTAIKDIKTESGKLLDCFTEKCELPNLCVILPQKSDKKLHVVKKVIKGAILISEGLASSEDIAVKSETNNNLTEDSAVNASEHKRKKKRDAQDLDSSNLNNETKTAENVISSLIQNKHELKENTTNSTIQPKRKKEKKKKHDTQNFENSDLNYDTEDAENISSHAQNKHTKKHKKNKSERIEIKNEPLAMDLDAFPHCVSQK